MKIYNHSIGFVTPPGELMRNIDPAVVDYEEEFRTPPKFLDLNRIRDLTNSQI